MKEIKDVPQFVKNLIASIAKLVQDLLLVTACKMFNENHEVPASSIMNEVKYDWFFSPQVRLIEYSVVTTNDIFTSDVLEKSIY